VRNKACLITEGFSQVEGLDFVETFAHVAHFEAIRILLAFATSNGFKLYQMDVKNTFLHGVIQEEVFVRQPYVSRTPSILIECTSIQKLYMGLSKHHGHAMLGLRPSC
jgi:hypothetical protein